MHKMTASDGRPQFSTASGGVYLPNAADGVFLVCAEDLAEAVVSGLRLLAERSVVEDNVPAAEPLFSEPVVINAAVGDSAGLAPA